MKESDAPSVVEDPRIHLDASAGGDLPRSPPRHIHPPKMTTIHVALISRKDHRRFVRRQRHVLDFEVSRRQGGQRSAGGRNRIEMHPAVFLRWKQQTIAGDPLLFPSEKDRSEEHTSEL